MPSVQLLAQQQQHQQQKQQLISSFSYLANLSESDLEIFTDGSAVDGTNNHGVGHVAFSYDAIIHQWNAPIGSQSNSFHLESVAFAEPLHWLRNYDNWR